MLQLEQSIYQFLQSNEECAKDAILLYLAAIHKVGAAFYEGGYPLILLDLLFYLALRKNEIKESHKDDIFHICADFLLDSKKPLDTFTLPITSSFDDLMSSM